MYQDSPIKVPADVYSALFQAPGVDEELMQVMDSSGPSASSSDLRKALDMFLQDFMHLGALDGISWSWLYA